MLAARSMASSARLDTDFQRRIPVWKCVFLMLHSLCVVLVSQTSCFNGDIPPLLDERGGTVELIPGQLTVSAEPGALLGTLRIDARVVEVPSQKESGYAPVSPGFQIQLSDQELLEGTLQFSLPYDDSTVDPSTLRLIFYDEEEQQPRVSLPLVNLTKKEVLFSLRSFPIVRLESTKREERGVAFKSASNDSDKWLPREHTVTSTMDQKTKFEPGIHGFGISNPGFPEIGEDGVCEGMVVAAYWNFRKKLHQLSALSEPTQETLALLMHIGVQRSQDEWTVSLGESIYEPNPCLLIDFVKQQIDKDELVYIVLYAEKKMDADREGRSRIGHAVLAYGYKDGLNPNQGEFLIYDPNYPKDATRRLVYANGQIEPYQDGTTTYREFTQINIDPSIVAWKYAKPLVEQALGEFKRASAIEITKPEVGLKTTDRYQDLTGSILNQDIIAASDKSAYVWTKVGVLPLTLSGADNTFSGPYPIFDGPNTLIAWAAPKEANFLYGTQFGVRKRRIEGRVKATKLFLMLTWRGAGDLDLYVTEPRNGQTAWYGKERDQTTDSGLKLIRDEENQGAGGGTEAAVIEEPTEALDGWYCVRVHNFKNRGADGTDRTNRGKVIIAIDDAEHRDNVRMFPFQLKDDGSTNDQPGSQGSDWRDVAMVDYEQQEIIGIKEGKRCK